MGASSTGGGSGREPLCRGLRIQGTNGIDRQTRSKAAAFDSIYYRGAFAPGDRIAALGRSSAPNADMLAMTSASAGGTMSPEELKLKVEELRTLIIEKIAELEDEAQWGDAEQREELADELEQLVEQAHILRDLLQEEQ